MNLKYLKILFLVTTVWLAVVTINTFFFTDSPDPIQSQIDSHLSENQLSEKDHDDHHQHDHESLDKVVNQRESQSFEALPLSHQSDILIRKRDLRLFKTFVENNPILKTTINEYSKEDGRTLLTRASFNGNLEFIKYIVEDLKADINIADRDKITPLMEAAGSENFAVLKYLVESGANIHTENKLGADALTMALGGAHEEMVSLLISRGANVNHTWNKNNFSYLMNAARSGHLEVAKLLLNGKAKINQQDLDGNTALHYASSEGFIKLVELLKAKGASLTLRNQKNQTARSLAIKNGFKDIDQVLK
ncbi:hypothetical protein A9Q84_03005 [Halobacteriovorax marinus]|mgnify:CR=1 FL=1|uniref:Uncharacterized protein n=1 Tax=Halobacteriovorax marinus TaxID=97084 RepID=A0A1Y5FJI8_9BACT|nr:hypothetical protein A9Q84_03005 [Halobacteriovorax marinus]